MDKPTCKFCGMAFSQAVLNGHEGRCRKNPANGWRDSMNEAPSKVGIAPAPIVAPAPAPVERDWNDVITESSRPEGWVRSSPQVDSPPREEPERPSEQAMREAFAPSPDPKTQAQVAAVIGLRDGVLPVPAEEIVLVTAPSANGVYIPTSNPSYTIPRDLGTQLDRIEIMAKSHPQNILLIGQQGAGKTELAKQFAAKYHRPMYVVPCVTMMEESQWWGSYGVSQERGTFYTPSAFIKAIETPRAVICLDDMNRTNNPKVLNPLFPLLDDRRETHLDELNRTVRVAPEVVFFATVNEGFAFQGTDPIDQALRDRFDQMNVGYPPALIIRQILIQRTGCQMQDAEIISKFAGSLAEHRTNPVFISMRQLIRIAESRVAGARIRDAVHFTMTAGLQPEELQGVMQVLQTLLPSDYQAEEPRWEKWG